MAGMILQRLTGPNSKPNFGLLWKIHHLNRCLWTNTLLPHDGWLTGMHYIACNLWRLEEPHISCRNSILKKFKKFEKHRYQNVCTRMFSVRVPRKEPKAKKGGRPKILLSDEEIQDVLDISAFRSHLAVTVEKLKESYVKNLSLRTSSGRIESLAVDFDGGTYPLSEMAEVVRKNPSLVLVNMVSLPQAIRAVLDAIQKSGMNLNPQQEGTTIYVPIPQITREHRENLAKNAKMLFNRTKDELHDIQNRTIKTIKQKKSDFSEDLIFNVQQQIMALTNASVTEAEEILHKKVAELLGGK